MFAKCVWPEMKKVRVNWLNLRDIIATFNRKAKQKQKSSQTFLLYQNFD
jgi:hypothetical protein